MSGEVLTVHGTVVSSAHDIHSVDVDLNGTTHRVLAKRSGKLQMRRIRVLPGDVVTVELSPLDPSRGRITHRGR